METLLWVVGSLAAIVLLWLVLAVSGAAEFIRGEQEDAPHWWWR